MLVLGWGRMGGGRWGYKVRSIFWEGGFLGLGAVADCF